MVGGVSVVTQRLVAALGAGGDDVRVLTRYRPDRVEQPHVRLTAPPIPRAALPAFAAAIAASWRPDVIVATTWAVAPSGRTRAPLLVLGHGSDLTRPPRDPARFARVMSRAAGRLVVSRFLRESLAARGFVSSVLPIPVTIGRARAPAALRKLGFVARAIPGKGGERFVRLIAALGLAGEVIGDGPQLPRWRALAGRVGANIAFLGACPTEQVAVRLAGWDLAVVLPTAPEGLGLVPIEAAAAGVPTVGCEAGGLVEALGPGLVVARPGDAVAVATQIAQWFTPARGGEAWAWVAAAHGEARAVTALRRALGGSSLLEDPL